MLVYIFGEFMQQKSCKNVSILLSSSISDFLLICYCYFATPIFLLLLLLLIMKGWKKCIEKYNTYERKGGRERSGRIISGFMNEIIVLPCVYRDAHIISSTYSIIERKRKSKKHMNELFISMRFFSSRDCVWGLCYCAWA